MAKKNTKKIARSAITGKFVKSSYAKKHPKTTVRRNNFFNHDKKRTK